MTFIPEFGYTIDLVKDISCLSESPFKTHRRLKVFAQKGCSCVSCGVTGTVLARGVRRNNTKSWDVYTEDFRPLTVDHIVPRSKGGTSDIENLQPMCYSCNQLKGNQSIKTQMNRKLARIAEITDIKPIEGADTIECAVVENGWNVVVKKNEYQKGDVAIYCEVDSWIPHDLAPFLSKGNEPREYNGVRGERLRTVKLRGQISQGLLIKPSSIPLNVYACVNDETGEPYYFDDLVWEVGDDVTADLGIQKYEPPVPAQLAGDIEGLFPSFIPKTDQERCQNLYDEIFNEHYNETYEVTIKLDGTSCTIYYKDGKFGVCSRNWELKETKGNTLWKCAREQGIIDGLEKLGRNLAIQGEVIGEGIQGNQEKIKGQRFFIFDIYDIDAGRYLNAHERYGVDMQLFIEGPIPHVPIHGLGKVLKDNNFKTIEELLDYADGPSMNPQAKREGLVFKSLDSDFTFKAISNKWLLKNDG